MSLWLSTELMRLLDPHSPDVGEGDRDVQHIVSPEIIRQDDGFVTYMTATNNR